MYRCESSYYLVLRRIEGTESNVNSIENILAEYGDRVMNVLFFEGYLNEYGPLMMDKNAIGFFARMA